MKLRVNLSDREVDLVEEGYDLAIRIARLPDSTLISKPLANTPMMLCASPRYLEVHGASRHPRELSEHRVIAYSYWSMRDKWIFAGPGASQDRSLHDQQQWRQLPRRSTVTSGGGYCNPVFWLRRTWNPVRWWN